jgi:ATP-binding cassette subfamily F protein 3
VATRIVEIDNGEARDYHGDYEYYLWKKAQEIDSIKGAPEHVQKPTGQPRSPTPTPRDKSGKGRGGQRRDLSKALARADRQVARLEGEIAGADDQIRARDTELADHALYQDPHRWEKLSREREQWIKEQAARTSQWAVLCEEAEGLRAQVKELDSQIAGD